MYSVGHGESVKAATPRAGRISHFVFRGCSHSVIACSGAVLSTEKMIEIIITGRS